MGLESHTVLDGSLRGLQSQYRYAYTQNTFTFLGLVFRSSGTLYNRLNNRGDIYNTIHTGEIRR